MPYPQSTLKMVFGGPIAGDIWRTSIDFNVTPNPLVITDATMNLLAVQGRTYFDTAWAQIKTHNGSGVGFQSCWTYFYPNGSSAATHQGFAGGTNVPGTAATSGVPFRTALVVTKHTDFSGRKNMGRMYIPATASLGVSVLDGQVTGSTVPDYALYMKGVFDAANAADWTPYGFTGHHAIVTSASATQPGNVVTSISVNSLPDTQRRRTNKDVPNLTDTRPIA